MARAILLILMLVLTREIRAVNSSEHWAFQPPSRPIPPTVRDRSWVRHPLDLFVLTHLENARSDHAPDANRATLLRRASFAMTGLPPSLDEHSSFLAAEIPDAYERAVDRLLASPRYGERMATHWLDVARYADTHGYHADTHRDMWRWRDWVILAWNRDLAFEQFTIEQLAGDLLPQATLDQQIASGFNRNHMVNFEDGAIAAEYLAEYVADRVTTTSTVWLGLTVQCARCHDHKHDPISQRDFYQLYAFFHNVAEQGLDGQRGNAVPVLNAPTRLQQEKLAELSVRIARTDRELENRLRAADPEQEAWERRTKAGAGLTVPLPVDTLLHFTLDDVESDTVRDRLKKSIVGSVTAGAKLVPGNAGRALLLDGETIVTIPELARWRSADPLTISLSIFPTTLDDCTLVARIDPRRNDQGLTLSIIDRKLEFRCSQDGNVVTLLAVRAQVPLVTHQWQNVTVAWDGWDRPDGIRLFVDGVLSSLHVEASTFVGPLVITEPLQIGGRSDGDGDGFRGLIDDVRIYARALRLEEIELFSGRDPLSEILALAPARRTPDQRRRIRQQFLESTDVQFRQSLQQRRRDDLEHVQLEKSAPTTMVMRELPDSRPTFVLTRGLYDHPEERVEAGLPRIFSTSAPQLRDRLDLARWLGSSRNPLAGRVMANRLWQLHFGRGLVATPDDFGTRGERPSHPEALDWLAYHFLSDPRESVGSMKRLQRQLFLSSTFRQSSVATARQRELDPDNATLCRGPRLRLSAEMIRDQALAVSGLLESAIGGLSVFPYQPPGLWEEVAYDTQSFSAQSYTQSHGADLVRRGLYTFWKRAVPPTSLAIWDAPDREVCTVTRSHTNTPLQALSIMNEPTFVEAARFLAETLLARSGELSPDATTRILNQLFLRITSREPTLDERLILRDLYQSQLSLFRTQPDAAVRLLQVGEIHGGPAAVRQPGNGGELAPTRVLEPEVAAITTVIGAILSLDEALSRY